MLFFFHAYSVVKPTEVPAFRKHRRFLSLLYRMPLPIHPKSDGFYTVNLRPLSLGKPTIAQLTPILRPFPFIQINRINLLFANRLP